ncbi:MAG: rRNA maturation RNase YbeY [Bacteroidales bacterium]|nr:rRNA maturation RNase YbeY [Bacteroidales bacterium]
MVRYFIEDISFKFNKKRFTKLWLENVALNEGKTLGDINIIFCSDPYILDVNQRFLQHTYYTDIITFDYCEGDILSGDLFISIDTVRDNSLFYHTDFNEELNRVIVHGILHLVGYDDHSESDIAIMRSKEDQYLLLRTSLFSCQL